MNSSIQPGRLERPHDASLEPPLEAFDPVRRLAAEALGSALLLAVVVGSGIMGQRLAAGNDAVALLERDPIGRNRDSQISVGLIHWCWAGGQHQ